MHARRGTGAGRPIALLIVAALSVWGAAAGSARAAEVPTPAPSTGTRQTWIVTLHDGVDASVAGRLLTRQQSGTLTGVYSHVLDGFSFTGTADAAAAIARNPFVVRVEAARGLHAVEIAPNGILRTSAWAAHGAGYTGVTSGGTRVRVAVVDTGIQLDHPDLAGNIDAADGVNCINPGQPPNDDHGHGTHVAGTVGAAFNGVGVVGMATNVQLVPVKVLNSTGFGTDAQVICGLDAVAALAQAQPGPYVVNMSLGDPNRPNETTCGASALHQAICNLTAGGVTVVAAAGNDGTDAVGFVPAAYDEVIAVSAFTDFDGQRSFAGCQTDFSDYLYQCDDNLADFSNYGSVVDVTAPGVHVLSDWIGGGQSTISGSSMAAPHVAGAAALVLGANPALTPAQVRSVLQTTGECPDGSVANAPTCAGHGQWQVGSLFGGGPDKDGIPEPLINALRAAQAAGSPSTPPPPPPPPPYTSAPQGSWVGTYGSQGYALAGWNGTSDLASLPGATLTLDQGTRYCWVCTTTSDVRALQSADKTSRRAGVYYDANQIRAHLTFTNAYTGTLRVYVVDWDTTARREDLTVTDATGPHTISITTDVSQGAWVAFPVTVAAGGTVTLTATRTAGMNVVLSGIFLGDAGPPPPPPPPPYTSAPQGSWVGTYGSQGYALAGWNGTSDLASLPGATLTLDQGTRYCWVCTTTSDVRALQSADKTSRRAGVYYDANQIRAHLTFTNAYTGTLRVYVVDWDTTARREDLTVTDATGPHTISITTDVSQGAWVAFPVTVAAGGTVTLTATRTAGMNVVLSGIFLGDAGPPPPPPPPPYTSAPQGSWVGTYGSQGYALAGWNGTSDLASLPGATLTLDQGTRYCWVCTTTSDVRALQSADKTSRRAGVYYDANQIRAHLTFTNAYTGTLRVYVVDWDTTARREDLTVTDATGPHTISITTDVSQGAWVAFPVTVAAGGTVTLTATRTAGMNVVLSGIFLG